MKSVIYNTLSTRKKHGQKSFAVLIDPDKVTTSVLDELVERSVSAKVDFLLVGGSLVISNQEHHKKLNDSRHPVSRQSLTSKQIRRRIVVSLVNLGS